MSMHHHRQKRQATGWREVVVTAMHVAERRWLAIVQNAGVETKENE